MAQVDQASNKRLLVQERSLKILGGRFHRVAPKTLASNDHLAHTHTALSATEGSRGPMSVIEAQRTKVVRMPEFLSPDEIDQVSMLGSGLLQEAEDAELRYDAGMFANRTREQMRFLEANPSLARKFPFLVSQIKMAGRRAKRSEELLASSGVEVRSYNYSNNWHVAYLQAIALLERRLPVLLAKILAAAGRVDKDEGWGLLDSGYHVRCAEYHRQRAPSSALPDKRHYDENSLVTIDILLNDGFSGGEFCTLEANDQLAQHEFHRAGDAVVFVSHKYHCVMPITRGERRVLVLELWQGPARRCAHRCGSLGHNCLLENEFVAGPCTRRGVHTWCDESSCLACYVVGP